jgi:hypothetical protein
VNARWLRRRITYDGSQLRPHWILRATGVFGDAIVGFRGACALPASEFADLEDQLAGAQIAGSDMVHFIIERFDGGDLDRATVRQRLLAARVGETLASLAPTRARRLRRVGDDLFYGDGKLSISIATKSAVSTLIHFAINVSTAGTPVVTAGLEQLGIEVGRFAREVLERTKSEELSMAHARCKVRARGEA